MIIFPAGAYKKGTLWRVPGKVEDFKRAHLAAAARSA